MAAVSRKCGRCIYLGAGWWKWRGFQGKNKDPEIEREMNTEVDEIVTKLNVIQDNVKEQEDMEKKLSGWNTSKC